MARQNLRRNLNRGYMKLEVWKRSMELFQTVWKHTHGNIEIDLKLRSQLDDSAQSVAANIAEGYSRRSVREYIQFSYIALSSLSETMTRTIGLFRIGLISKSQFEAIDKIHFEVENKLISLIRSLERKRDKSEWTDRIHEESEEFDS